VLHVGAGALGWGSRRLPVIGNLQWKYPDALGIISVVDSFSYFFREIDIFQLLEIDFVWTDTGNVIRY
jgi:hypothetical protein